MKEDYFSKNFDDEKPTEYIDKIKNTTNELAKALKESSLNNS